MIRLWLLMGVAALPVCSAELVRIASSNISYNGALKPIPQWSGDALIVVERHSSLTPLFRLFDRTGREIEDIPFTFPGAGLLSIRAWAHSRDGTLAVCGFTADRAGRSSNFVAWMKAGGKGLAIVRTDNYEPAGVAITDDLSVWAVGSTYTSSSLLAQQREYPPDPPVFRRWDRAGKLIGTYMPQGRLHNILSVQRGAPYRVFASAGDRVGWLAFYENRYLEISVGGQVTDISNLQLPPVRPGSAYFMALLANDHGPYLGITHNMGWDLGKIDLSERKLIGFTSGPPKTAFFLLGGDGNELVGIAKPPENLLEFFHFK